jgi:hypothetical protein
MLRECGLKSEVLLISPISSGGFDSSFVSMQFLKVPLIITTIQGKRYCTFPYGNSVFGQYPKEFLGLQGLNLESKTIETIPPPVYSY